MLRARIAPPVDATFVESLPLRLAMPGSLLQVARFSGTRVARFSGTDKNKQLQVAIEHEPHLADRYSALLAFFDGRNSAIVDGIARSNEKVLLEKALKERPAAAPATMDKDR